MPFEAALFRLAAALALALGPRMLAAQSPALRDSVLMRLTAEALAANPSLFASRAMARAAESRSKAAGALPDPMLTAGVMDLTLPGFHFHESDFSEVDVELSQQFPWPGTLGARTEAARAEARARDADARARRRDLVVRTAELYYRLRYIVTARATLARQRGLLATGVDISTARYATTTAPQSDPLQARVALARLDTEEADLAAQEVELRAQLKALRNVPGRDSLTIEPIQAALVPSEVYRPSAATTEESADSRGPHSLPEHPRLAARRAEIEAAEQTVRVEQLGARPDFTLAVRYGYRPTINGFNFPDFFSAFIGVRLPLFAGRKQLRLADAARADAEAAGAALADEQAGLAEEIRTVRAQIRSGATRLRLLTDQVVPAAQATVDASLRVYRVGKVEFLTVLASEDALYRAELDAAQVASEYLTHLVVLEQLLARED
jgi:outer membrane protein, heavy metal efflux system